MQSGWSRGWNKGLKKRHCSLLSELSSGAAFCLLNLSVLKFYLLQSPESSFTLPTSRTINDAKSASTCCCFRQLISHLATPQLHHPLSCSEALSPGPRSAQTCSFSANSLHLSIFTSSCCVCEKQAGFIPVCAEFKNSLIQACLDPKNNIVSLNPVICLVCSDLLYTVIGDMFCRTVYIAK